MIGTRQIFALSCHRLHKSLGAPTRNRTAAAQRSPLKSAFVA